MNRKNIQWNFIPDQVPWWGGFYKRLIGIVKSSIKKVLQRALLNYEELYTAITETESVMNPPLLTFLTEKEFNENLSPNHLIYGRDIATDKCTPHFEELHDIEQLKGMRKHCLLTLNHFKRRFYTE